MGKKICTFRWKKKHYYVDELIEWVHTTKQDTLSKLSITNDFLYDIDPNVNWGNLKVENNIVVSQIPLSMFDIVEHAKRALRTDLSFPIVVLHTNPEKYSDHKEFRILDGMHRVLHAAIVDIFTLPMYLLEETDLDEFMNTHKEALFDEKIIGLEKFNPYQIEI